MRRLSLIFIFWLVLILCESKRLVIIVRWLEESLKFTQNNKELLKLPQIPSQNFAVTKVVGAYSIKLYGSVNSAFIAMAKF